MSENLSQKWHELGQEALSGVAEWRSQHPKATLREIEAEIDDHLGKLRARMIQDVAETSKAAAWNQEAEQETPRCPQCGTGLRSRGKQERTLQTSGGKKVKVTRAYGTCPSCGYGLFPPR